MKKTHFKTYLFFEGNKIANEVLIYAALSNAGGKNIELRINGLFAYAMSLKLLSKDDLTQVERVGENKLHIDARINGQWENVLIVEQVEVFDFIPNEIED